MSVLDPCHQCLIDIAPPTMRASPNCAGQVREVPTTDVTRGDAPVSRNARPDHAA